MVVILIIRVNSNDNSNTAQNMKFSIKDFFSKCDQIRRFLRIWSHLLKKFLMENIIFYAVQFAVKLYKITGIPCAIKTPKSYFFSNIFKKLRSKS